MITKISRKKFIAFMMLLVAHVLCFEDIGKKYFGPKEVHEMNNRVK